MFSQANFERDMFQLKTRENDLLLKIVPYPHVFRYSARLCDNQDVSKVKQFDEKPEEISINFVKGDSKKRKIGKEEGKERKSIIT